MHPTEENSSLMKAGKESLEFFLNETIIFKHYSCRESLLCAYMAREADK